MATKRMPDQSSNGEIDDMAMVAEALRAVSGASSAQSEEEEMLLAGMAADQPRLRGPAISPASFGQLGDPGTAANNGDIGLLLDVVLNLTVELGRTRLTVRDVLALGPGSIVELDKLAGEPVDIAVNGTCIAKGEVVVVDEKFAVRVTEILSPSRRIASAI
jgi:flagellar motor switch protein FliN